MQVYGCVGHRFLTVISPPLALSTALLVQGRPGVQEHRAKAVVGGERGR